MFNKKIPLELKQALKFIVLVVLIGNANFVMAKPKYVGILADYCDNPGRTVASNYANDFALISGCVGCHNPSNKSKDRTPLFSAYKKGDLTKICPINVPQPPANMPPTANANGPYSGSVGLAVKFSSAGSMDPNGDPITYSWTFGDGATSTKQNPSHTYAAMGVYTVSLMVADGNGGGDGATTTADIAAAPTLPPDPVTQAPVLDMIGDWNVKVGDLLNIPLSTTDADGDELAYDEMGLPADFILMDNGDGTGSISGTAMMPGKYDVTVTGREISSADMLADSEAFTITITDDTVVIPMYRFKGVEAEWKRNRKYLKVKGVLKSADIEGKDDMCSPMEGEQISISSDGKRLYYATVNCEGKFRGGIKIQSSSMSSCEITVSAEGYAESVTTKIGGCKEGDYEGDYEEESMDNDLETMTDKAQIKEEMKMVKAELRMAKKKKHRLKEKYKMLKRMLKKLED